MVRLILLKYDLFEKNIKDWGEDAYGRFYHDSTYVLYVDSSLMATNLWWSIWEQNDKRVESFGLR